MSAPKPLRRKPPFAGHGVITAAFCPAQAFFENGHLIQRKDRQMFWLAGLWDRWIGPDGNEVETCCVITTRPNSLMAPLHDRMPVIIPDGLENV